MMPMPTKPSVVLPGAASFSVADAAGWSDAQRCGRRCVRNNCSGGGASDTAPRAAIWIDRRLVLELGVKHAIVGIICACAFVLQALR
jgi:hypothetical protein